MSYQWNCTVRLVAPGTQDGQDVSEVAIPPGGCAASVLARELRLRLGNLRAVVVNHQTYSLNHRIQPGDLVAFVRGRRRYPYPSADQPRYLR